MLRAKAAQLGPGEWITGEGWQESNLAEKRNLSSADLDSAAPDNPVILVRAGGHSSVSNSRALELAGIDRNTPDPATGIIEHDSTGEPNGIIRERSDLISKLVPPAKWDEFASPTWMGCESFSSSVLPVCSTLPGRSTTNPWAAEESQILRPT